MMAMMENIRRLAGAAFLLTTLVNQPVLADTDLGPTLNKIQQSGTIYVGHREAAMPFSFVLTGRENEIPQGYSWDICMHVVDGIKEKLGRPDLKVVPVSMASATRIMMVKIGMADMECGVTTNTIARQKQVTFSNTFFVSEVRVMVKKDSGIRSLNDLAGKVIVTTTGATADRLVKAAALSRGVTFNYSSGRNHDHSMEMLVNGTAKAYVADDGILAGQRAKQNDPEQYVFLDENLSIEPYGLILRKDDPQFKSVVDEALVKLMQGGGVEKIYNKWFMEPIPPANHVLNMPMSDLLKAAIQYPNDQPAMQ